MKVNRLTMGGLMDVRDEFRITVETRFIGYSDFIVEKGYNSPFSNVSIKVEMSIPSNATSSGSRTTGGFLNTGM